MTDSQNYLYVHPAMEKHLFVVQAILESLIKGKFNVT